MNYVQVLAVSIESDPADTSKQIVTPVARAEATHIAVYFRRPGSFRHLDSKPVKGNGLVQAYRDAMNLAAIRAFADNTFVLDETTSHGV
jgi:hypothetical protein